MKGKLELLQEFSERVDMRNSRERSIIMKLLKLVLFVVIFLSVVAIGGCLEELRGTVDIDEINYSLYGPLGYDMNEETCG